MKYSNPPIPEGINAPERHPMRAFLKHLLVLIALIVGALFLIQSCARTIAPYVPFSWEENLAPAEILAEAFHDADSSQDVRKKLQTLADRVAAEMHMPEEISITVHYSEESTVNAFATVGGNVIIFKGLLGKIRHEETLAALLAHEMAHIKHRDVTASVLSGLGTAVLSAFDTSGFVFERTAYLSLLSYSRQQEDAADHEAFRVLGNMYNDVSGAVELFDILEKALMENPAMAFELEFFSSHPDLKKRKAAALALAGKNGWKALEPQIQYFPWK